MRTNQRSSPSPPHNNYHHPTPPPALSLHLFNPSTFFLPPPPPIPLSYLEPLLLPPSLPSTYTSLRAVQCITHFTQLQSLTECFDLTAANLKAEVHSSNSFLELAARHTC